MKLPYRKITLKHRKGEPFVINEIERKTDEIYDLHEYVQSLATEVEAIKLFLKEEFCLPKNSISKININTDAIENHRFAP